MRLSLISALCLAAPLPGLTFAAPEPAAAPAAQAAPVTEASIAAAIAVLDKIYWSAPISIWLDRPGDDLRGHFEGRINPPWWSAANAAELLIDYMNATGTAGHDAALATLHDWHRDPLAVWPRVAAALKERGQWKDGDERRLRQKKLRAPGYTRFRNEFLDDSGWWGIAWLKMHDRTRDPRYLETARAVHAHMAANWLAESGGGVAWGEEEGRRKANSITSNLFLILSARLAQRTGEKSYLEWAGKTNDWLHAQALFDGTGVVDGPGHKGDYWSYNQGTYIGGLLALSEAAARPELLDEAARVADRVLTAAGFTNADLVIVEKLGTGGWDGCLFKGILARYLRQLHDALAAAGKHPQTVARINRCLAATAASILRHSSTPDGQFTAEWHPDAKNREHNFNTSLSALTALTAALPPKSP